MYIKLDTLEYPLDDNNVRSHFPNVSFPLNFTAPDGYAEVLPSTKPEFNSITQRVTEGSPVQVDGAWYQSWVINEIYPTQEQAASVLAADARSKAKAAREKAVSEIKVTTQAGNTFDGDEVSQGRMNRAITGLSTGLAPSVNWVLADNSVIQATAAELTEALVLAGQAQAAIWVIP